ncbi:MAG: hypothetical protein RR925_03330, partial [Erysipelotrichaceae bacterium]
MIQQKINLYSKFGLCNCIWYLYFLSVYQNAGIIILLLFFFSAISFFALAISVNDYVSINMKRQYGLYLLMRLICFFGNIYLIRYWNIFIGSYVMIFFQLFEMIAIRYLKYFNKTGIEYNADVIKEYYTDIFLIGMIVFVSVLWIDTVKYFVFLLVFLIQIKMLHMEIKLKYFLAIIELIYI